jgi:uncharacterized protein (DUF1800 family)
MAQADRRLIAHLLRRAGFGCSPAEIEEYAALGFEGAVDHLINFEAVDDSGAEAAVAQVRAAYPGPTEPARPDLGNREWEALVWLVRMLHTKRPLQEKMTLFWHGHFTSSIQEVANANLMYGQNALYRSNALTTNLKNLTKAVARDPAMLIYLNNESNRAGKPNENWARELLELFAIGIGNYTEIDVKESARAFTGWTLNWQSGQFTFNAKQHDNASKTFLGVTGNLDGDNIIDTIFNQPAHSPFIARKLIRFFVYDDPDIATVSRLADVYVKSGFSIKELVRQLLLSPEFRSDKAQFSLVKSPVEFTVGALRTLDVQFTDYQRLRSVYWGMDGMGQRLYVPPNVGGWPGQRDWVSSTNFYSRANYSKQLLSLDGEASIDPVAIANAAGATTPEECVDFFVEMLLRSDMPAGYRSALVSFVGSFTSDKARDSRLRGLVRLIMSSPAYQMN